MSTFSTKDATRQHDSLEDEQRHFLDFLQNRGDFVQTEDGSYYFWPNMSGALAAYQLRWIADELERRNKLAP